MEVKQISQEEFKEVIKDEKVLIDCYATWCGPCKMMSPILDQVAKEIDTCKFYKLDVDEAEKIASEYGIYSIPTLLLFEKGKLKDQSIGLISKEDIKEMIK